MCSLNLEPRQGIPSLNRTLARSFRPSDDAGTMIEYVVILVISYIIAKFLSVKDPEKIHGVYSLPGKWYTLKYYLFYALFTLRERQNKNARAVKEGEAAGYGMRSRSTPQDMEKPWKLPPQQPLVSNMPLPCGAFTAVSHCRTCMRHTVPTFNYCTKCVRSRGIIHDCTPLELIYRWPHNWT